MDQNEPVNHFSSSKVKIFSVLWTECIKFLEFCLYFSVISMSFDLSLSVQCICSDWKVRFGVILRLSFSSPLFLLCDNISKQLAKAWLIYVFFEIWSLEILVHLLCWRCFLSPCSSPLLASFLHDIAVVYTSFSLV